MNRIAIWKNIPIRKIWNVYSLKLPKRPGKCRDKNMQRGNEKNIPTKIFNSGMPGYSEQTTINAVQHQRSTGVSKNFPPPYLEINIPV